MVAISQQFFSMSVIHSSSNSYGMVIDATGQVEMRRKATATGGRGGNPAYEASIRRHSERKSYLLPGR